MEKLVRVVVPNQWAAVPLWASSNWVLGHGRWPNQGAANFNLSKLASIKIFKLYYKLLLMIELNRLGRLGNRFNR